MCLTNSNYCGTVAQSAMKTRDANPNALPLAVPEAYKGVQGE